MYHLAWLIFVFLVQTGFRHVAWIGLELLRLIKQSNDLASQSPGIKGVSHHTWQETIALED